MLLRRSDGGGRVLFRVLAAEALHAAGGVHQLLLAGEKWMAVRADFNTYVALMCRAGHKCITTRAMHAHLVICGMNGWFHRDPISNRIIRFYRTGPGFSNGRGSWASAVRPPQRTW